MLVAYSRRVARRVRRAPAREARRGRRDAVMTAQATEDQLLSQFRRSKQEMRQLEADFKDPDHPLRIVVVKNMWLTGFDAPVMHTLYIDKPMRDHGLLQAIARVNRVFGDKAGGLVVDYIGIGDDLRASLTAYSSDEVDDVARSARRCGQAAGREARGDARPHPRHRLPPARREPPRSRRRRCWRGLSSPLRPATCSTRNVRSCS